VLIRARGGNTSATPSSLSRKVKKANEHGATGRRSTLGRLTSLAPSASMRRRRNYHEHEVDDDDDWGNDYGDGGGYSGGRGGGPGKDNNITA